MDDDLTVVCCPSLKIFGIASGPVCGSTSSVGKVVIGRGERDSQVTLGRDVSVTVQFTLGGLEEAAGAEGGGEEAAKAVSLWEDAAELGSFGQYLKSKFLKAEEEVKVDDVAVGVGNVDVSDGKPAAVVVTPWDVEGEVRMCEG